MTHTCTACQSPVHWSEAVQLGDGHRLRTWHRGCFEATHEAMPERVARPTAFEVAPRIPAQRTGSLVVSAQDERVAS